MTMHSMDGGLPFLSCRRAKMFPLRRLSAVLAVLLLVLATEARAQEIQGYQDITFSMNPQEVKAALNCPNPTRLPDLTIRFVNYACKIFDVHHTDCATLRGSKAGAEQERMVTSLQFPANSRNILAVHFYRNAVLAIQAKPSKNTSEDVLCDLEDTYGKLTKCAANGTFKNYYVVRENGAMYYNLYDIFYINIPLLKACIEDNGG